MSGNIMRTGSPDWWIASSGTYYWVLDYLAGQVTDEETAGQLRAASTHGFRTFDLGHLTPAQRREVVDLIQGPLAPAVAARFPGPHGETVRKFVDELTNTAQSWADPA
ncbi:hypothetical protein [Amycolatopsis australiensis]|uniref:Uncharacterized protein n=1 Tax=Amycolatopsis australiensis TaxID=546364 RepID=A0A1K1T2E0_9PSEU|nr:hypothetical protein [Amycolatopsis australiensis]SFW90511.1 hypothetical protein SAMN04489730_7595 [Amycolatopsis australiensis]